MKYLITCYTCGNLRTGEENLVNAALCAANHEERTGHVVSVYEMRIVPRKDYHA